MTAPELPALPIPMILFCPKCGLQHIDEPDELTPDWQNPPHRSHLCHGCGCIWRPADVATVGVRAIETKGKADTFDPASPRAAAEVGEGMVDAALDAYYRALQDGTFDKRSHIRAALEAALAQGGEECRG